jgi:putative flavoprotein involved in K+ transport
MNEDAFLVSTLDRLMEARNVVVATGLFQKPKVPTFANQLSSRIAQMHSSRYRNPGSLPEGAVLVVGSGQSGCQIAQELYQSGRTVYLCVGSAGRVPRRYRGRDVYDWLNLSGFLDRTATQLPNPRAKFAANPHVSGKNGGMTLNLHQFVRDGVRLLGRLRDARHEKVWLASDLKENLVKADKLEAEVVKLVDEYILKNSLDAPQEALPVLRDGYDQEEMLELDLAAAGITSVIWAMGYSFDFSLVKFPIFDSDGYPVQTRGVTAYPGLYFVGLPWLHKQKSGLLVGVGEDAEYIASQIAARQKETVAVKT